MSKRVATPPAAIIQPDTSNISFATLDSAGGACSETERVARQSLAGWRFSDAASRGQFRASQIQLRSSCPGELLTAGLTGGSEIVERASKLAPVG